MITSRDTPCRGGSALLEVLVALALLAVLGAAWVAMTGQLESSVHANWEREREIQGAARLLDQASLWSREEFHARFGVFRSGGYLVDVRPSSSVVFTISVLDTLAHVPLLTTAYYRRIETAASEAR